VDIPSQRGSDTGPTRRSLVPAGPALTTYAALPFKPDPRCSTGETDQLVLCHPGCSHARNLHDNAAPEQLSFRQKRLPPMRLPYPRPSM